MPLVQSWGILAYKNLWETLRENRREFGNVSGDYKINQQKAKVHTHTQLDRRDDKRSQFMQPKRYKIIKKWAQFTKIKL